MTAFLEPEHAIRVETITNRGHIRVLIHGEADLATIAHLDAALTAIPLRGIRSVLLDASDLRFFDVAGLRRLMGFARVVQQSGREITTCGATPMLHRVVRLLELPDELGLHRSAHTVR